LSYLYVKARIRRGVPYRLDCGRNIAKASAAIGAIVNHAASQSQQQANDPGGRVACRTKLQPAPDGTRIQAQMVGHFLCLR